jgi:hypothetical protein
MRAQKHEYPFEDFLADFDALEASGAFARGPFERVLSAALPHFRDRYPDERTRTYRYPRFMMSLSYVAAHMQDVDVEDLAVYGSARVGGLVSERLLRGVHELFNLPDGRTPAADPEPAEVLELARSYPHQ